MNISIHRSKCLTEKLEGSTIVVSMQHDNMYVGDQIIDKLFVFVMLDILLFSSSGNKYDPEIVQGIH